MKISIIIFVMFGLHYKNQSSVTEYTSASVINTNINKNDTLRDYVPDSITAARIAEAIFIPIYGEKYSKRCKPYGVELIDSTIWHVWGRPSLGRWSFLFGTFVGGGPEAMIQKKDGKILSVYHTK